MAREFLHVLSTVEYGCTTLVLVKRAVLCIGSCKAMNADSARGIVNAAAAQARPVIEALGKSKLALSGAALAVAGFFGIFGALSLTPQRGIISVYVMLFGATLIAFAFGANSELLAKYFGFIFQPNGQLYFMLIAGNLAWTIGILGVLAAAFTNFVAITSWYNTPEGIAATANLPPWLGVGQQGGSLGPRSSATGMVDTNDDELL